MGTAFWIRRFLLAFVIAAIAIACAQVLRGRELDYALEQGLIWGAIAAVIFTLARIRQSKKGVHCAVCGDVPDTEAAIPDETPPGNQPARSAHHLQ